MTKHLSTNDLISEIREKVYSQDYSDKASIDGVRILTLKTFPSEEGDFGEIMRLSEKVEFGEIPGFTLAQINRATLLGGSLKAWHLHLEQEEIWFVIPSGHVLVGLWDLRKNSPTCGVTLRIILGAGQSKLLYIPRGVAHGSKNLKSDPTELIYFVNRRFNIHEPDEKRIPWDTKGKDFWGPQEE